MFKIAIQLLTLSLMFSSGVALKEGVQLGTHYGGPNGIEYTGVDIVSPQQSIQVIRIRAGERVDGIGVEFTDPMGLKKALYHDGRGGKDISHELNPGEYVTFIDWGEGDRTRVMYIKFATNQGNTISGGNPTYNIGWEHAPEGYQLGGFYGTSGKELDSVGAVSIKVPGVTSAPAAGVIGMSYGNSSFNVSMT